MVLKIHIPSKLNDKQKQLFMEIAKYEDKISDIPPQNNENGTSKEEKKANEQEKEDVFGKFRNMWGGR